MTDQKKRYSIKELAERWHCSESNIIHYIEDGCLPLYAKSLLLTLMPLPSNDDESINETIFLKINAADTKKQYDLMDNYNRKHWGDNPFLPKPAKITLDQDFRLEDEDIAKASIDNFSQCFTYQVHVDEFEIKNSTTNLNKTTGFTGKDSSVAFTMDDVDIGSQESGEIETDTVIQAMVVDNNLAEILAALYDTPKISDHPLR